MRLERQKWHKWIKREGEFRPGDLDAPWSSQLMGRTAETLPESKGLVRSVKNLLQTFQQAGCSWRKLTESINTSEWQTDTHMHSYDPAWTLWDECGLWTWVTWTNWFMFYIMLLLLLYHLVIAIQQAGRGWMLEPFYLILINSIIVLWYYCLIN